MRALEEFVGEMMAELPTYKSATEKEMVGLSITVMTPDEKWGAKVLINPKALQENRESGGEKARAIGRMVADAFRQKLDENGGQALG